MGRVEKSIEIRAPPEKIWEMFAVDRLKEWDEGSQKNLKSMEYISEVSNPEDKFRVGASARITDNRGKQFIMEVKESIENEKIIYHSDLMRSFITYALEPVEAGTKYTYLLEYEMPWGVLGKFLNGLILQRMAEKEVERSLEQLKNILEK